MIKPKFKLYLASGIRLWNLYFKDQYSNCFNKKIDLFQPALIDNQFARDHKIIPIKIATKDCGEINKCDAILAYMKPYDTQGNGPAGTDSSWECGYAIGQEKPTIMLVEDLEHLDYYQKQWMITFSIGAILTTNAEVANIAQDNEKFTHTKILFCATKDQFENKIINYLENYYRSIYAREGKINKFVDSKIRNYAKPENILKLLNVNVDKIILDKKITELLEANFNSVYGRNNKFSSSDDFKKICRQEIFRAKAIKNIISQNYDHFYNFLDYNIFLILKALSNELSVLEIANIIEYWLNIPAKKIKNHDQGNKKTRPALFYELFDLVSHHIVESRKYFKDDFVYRAGAILEIYNWLNTYAIDDVFDNSKTRQNHLTLCVKLRSRKNALLLGGLGHLLALKILFLETKERMEVGKQLIITLNSVQENMYKGQMADLALSFTKKSLQQFLKTHTLSSAIKIYFKRIYGICGNFYEQIGKMAMQATDVSAQFFCAEEVEDACIKIAKLFGLTQMIRNDLGDFIFPIKHSKLSKGMKNTSHNDIAAGKLTLPLIYTLLSNKVSKRQKKILLNYFGKQNLSLNEKLRISKIIWESGSIDFSIKYIEIFCYFVKNEYIQHIHETPTRLKWIIKLMEITPLINKTFRQMAESKKWKKLETKNLSEKQIEKMLENLK